MLSTAQIKQFWTEGVVVVNAALNRDQLGPLCRQHQQWIDQSRQHLGPFGEMLDGRPRFDVEPVHCAERPALRRVSSPEEISKEYFDLVFERGPLIDAVVDLLGQNIRFHHAKLNSKLPNSGTVVKWHQDFPFDPHSNDDCVTAMLFLDDIDSEIGPARVVPGSHRGQLHSLWQDGVFTGAVADSVAADCERQAVECLGDAGSLCLMHTRTLHASSANLTDRTRSLFIATLTAADAVPLAPNAVPSIHAGRIAHGQEPGRIRSIELQVDTPEIPKGASFFSQQATLPKGDQ